MRVCWLPPRCRWDLRSSGILRRPLDPWRCDRKVVPKRRYGITSVCCVKFQQSSDLVKLKPRYTPQNSEFLCLHPYCVPLCPVPTQCLRFTACVATYFKDCAVRFTQAGRIPWKYFITKSTNSVCIYARLIFILEVSYIIWAYYIPYIRKTMSMLQCFISLLSSTPNWLVEQPASFSRRTLFHTASCSNVAANSDHIWLKHFIIQQTHEYEVYNS